MKKLSWNPRRHGERYCSPACGAGCTWAAYEEAVRRATDLAARSGWEPDVWENFGWHYGARLQVGEHCLLLSERDRYGVDRTHYRITGGPSEWVRDTEACSPKAAIEKLQANLRARCDELQAMLDAIEKAS